MSDMQYRCRSPDRLLLVFASAKSAILDAFLNPLRCLCYSNRLHLFAGAVFLFRAELMVEPAEHFCVGSS